MSKKLLYLLIFPVLDIFNNEDKLININLRTNTEQFTIKINRSETIKELKVMIKTYFNMEIGDKMFYDNKKLNDELRLIDYGINDNDFIEIVLKEPKLQL